MYIYLYICTCLCIYLLGLVGLIGFFQVLDIHVSSYSTFVLKMSSHASPAIIAKWSGSVNFFFLHIDRTFFACLIIFCWKLDIYIIMCQLWKFDFSSLLGFVAPAACNCCLVA